MKIQQAQTLQLTHAETVDAIKRGLKAKYKRRTIGKGIDNEDVTVTFDEEVDSEGVGTGALVSCTVVLPAFDEEVLEEEAPAAETEAKA